MSFMTGPVALWMRRQARWLGFSGVIGNAGRVIAFEPSQDNFARLQAAVADHSTVASRLLGLSNGANEAWVRQGADELGATSEIIKLRSSDSDHLQPVRVDSGDRLIGRCGVLPPNIIKIDVEGHECEVIEGLKATLRDPALRAVFIEMH